MVPNQHQYCVMGTAVLFAATLCSTFFILNMTFDRFYSIIRPHKAASFNTVKRAKISIVCAIIFSASFNIPHLFMTKSDGRRCIPLVIGMDTVIGQFYYWLSFTATFALPFVLLLNMNSVIIHTLRASSSFRAKRETGQGRVQGQISKTKNSEKQIYVILLLVTFSFLLFNLPSFVFFLYVKFYNYMRTPRTFAVYILFLHIAHKMYFTNCGINFFLYVISGGKFRTDLLEILKCARKKTTNNVPSLSSEANTISTPLSI